MSVDLACHIGDIARRLLGEPNNVLSTRSQLRFGTNGSVAVEIAGEKRGSWFDHENGVGGGPLDLIRAKLGLVNSEAFDWLYRELGVGDEPRKPNGKDRIGDFECAYDYRDERGELFFQVVRFKNPKTFRQRRLVDGRWDWHVKGTRPVLYRLQELIAAPIDRTVWITEGEKDVASLVKLGLVATCNPGGAVKRGDDGKPARQKWRPEYNPFFRGRDVVILPHNDVAGHDLGHTIEINLRNVAARVRILDLPGLDEKGDVTDWLHAGGSREKLRTLVERTPPYRPNTGNSNGHADEEQTTKTNSPIITVKGGERHNVADAGLAALHAAEIAFYQRDQAIVRVCKIKAKASNGDTIFVPGIVKVTPAILERELGRAAVWERFDFKLQAMVRIDPPRPVINQILDMIDEWPFPPLSGIIACPTLRPDGSLLSREGYDPATGLVLCAAVLIPPIPDRPTREQAVAAAQHLCGLLAEFPFANSASKAVALSMLMTPVLRGAMDVAPMHLSTAPEAGTGKSYLADTSSTLATNERIAVVAVAPNPEETEKRLIGAALSGYPIIGLDNCRATLEGDFLCQVTERPLMQLRALGKSDKIRIPNTFTTFANGNNTTTADDMVRRTVICALDANIENPETREFQGNPLADVRANRGAYIGDILTIARAYMTADKPDRLAPLPSYEGWSDFVRSPLVWLGYADPVDTMATARAADPVRQGRARVFAAWLSELGEASYTAAEIIEQANARYDYDQSFVRPALRAALLEVAQKLTGSGDTIEPRRLGKWLAKNENTIAAGRKLNVDRTDKSRVRYSLAAPQCRSGAV
jgi:putative DNA primase/helicase